MCIWMYSGARDLNEQQWQWQRQQQQQCRAISMQAHYPHSKSARDIKWMWGNGRNRERAKKRASERQGMRESWSAFGLPYYGDRLTSLRMCTVQRMLYSQTKYTICLNAIIISMSMNAHCMRYVHMEHTQHTRFFLLSSSIPFILYICLIDIHIHSAQ